MQESTELFESNRPSGELLSGVFSVMDGARLPCAEYIDSDLQNAYYEGYTGNVEVGNLLVFDFFGELIHAGVNYPGSWHDNRVAKASGLVDLVLDDEETPTEYAVLCDSAFGAGTRGMNGKVVRARKTNETKEIPVSEEMYAIDLILQRFLLSERQSAEWGVRSLKGPFGRLRFPLPADSYVRQRVLEVCCHLLNRRTRTIGLNHIRTTYAHCATNCSPWREIHE